MRPAAAPPLPLSEFERLVERLSGSAETFPPCDVLCTRDGGLRITLAVAGFGLDDLAVTVCGNQLVVRGRRQPDATPRHYLHRGIAMRRFQRSFVLGGRLRVGSACLENGLLNIELQRTEPAAACTIRVGAPGPEDV